MLNKVTLIGRLGDQPELSTTQAGLTLTKLSLATSESFKDKQTGQKCEETEWHRIVMFGRLAEIANQYLQKGSMIYLEGKIKTRMWEKDGVKRYSTEIIASEMKMLDAKGQQQGQQRAASNSPAQHRPQSQPHNAVQAHAQYEAPPQGFSEDIPF